MELCFVQLRTRTIELFNRTLIDRENGKQVLLTLKNNTLSSEKKQANVFPQQLYEIVKLGSNNLSCWFQSHRLTAGSRLVFFFNRSFLEEKEGSRQSDNVKILPNVSTHMAFDFINSCAFISRLLTNQFPRVRHLLRFFSQNMLPVISLPKDLLCPIP